jgi:hypothetical protein
MNALQKGIINMDNDIKIVIPLYNDWNCFYLLIDKIEQTLPKDVISRIGFVLVNDCSLETIDKNKIRSSFSIDVINLIRNMGHQRAIAIGLSYIALNSKCDNVIVMDADGEDRPEDIVRILAYSDKNRNNIIFAKRTKRREKLTFRFFYQLYKIAFKLLTGRTINFGNFCLIPYQMLEKLVYVSEIWNHFAGGVIRSQLTYRTISSERGTRLVGTSKMNYMSLIMHGISAISVYIDMVSVRLITITALMIIISIIGILTVIIIKLFTNLAVAVPGWASYTTLGFILLLFQAFFMCLFLVFTVLSQRMQKQVLPIKEFQNYILNVDRINMR